MRKLILIFLLAGFNSNAGFVQWSADDGWHFISGCSIDYQYHSDFGMVNEYRLSCSPYDKGIVSTEVDTRANFTQSFVIINGVTRLRCPVEASYFNTLENFGMNLNCTIN